MYVLQIYIYIYELNIVYLIYLYYNSESKTAKSEEKTTNNESI